MLGVDIKGSGIRENRWAAKLKYPVIISGEKTGPIIWKNPKRQGQAMGRGPRSGRVIYMNPALPLNSLRQVILPNIIADDSLVNKMPIDSIDYIHYPRGQYHSCST